jgi:phage terminase large subunit
MIGAVVTPGQAQEVLAACADPEWFAAHVLGLGPTPAARAAGYTSALTPDQQAIVQSVRTHRRTAVPAAVGVGKTRAAAILAVWFLYTHPGSKVVTTAPNGELVETLLWREIAALVTGAAVPLGGTLLQTELRLAPDWFAIGLSPQRGAEEQTAVRFAGFHAPAMLIIFDEATGVHPSIWEASEGLAVGPDDHYLAIGNPVDPTSAFKRQIDSGLWHVITVSAETHPNVIHQNPAIIPGAVTHTWLAERLKAYGDREHPMYRAKARGLWPEQGPDMLISLGWVEAAQAAWRPPSGDPLATGCDVARYGDDDTVLQDLWADGTFGTPEVLHGQAVTETAGRLLARAVEVRVVDDSGVGGGVTDILVAEGSDVTPLNNAQAPEDGEHYANARAETYWALREALRKGEVTLPPDEEELAADLTNLKYSYDGHGRIVLEPKSELRRRLKRSPDRGDAAVLAYWGRREAIIGSGRPGAIVGPARFGGSYGPTRR